MLQTLKHNSLAKLKGFEVTDFIHRKEARKLDKFSQYAMVVADEAFNDSGLNMDKIDSDRAGVVWGSGIGGMQTFFNESVKLRIRKWYTKI